MDRPTRLLQALRSQVSCWVDPIKRGVGATDVQIAPASAGEFTLTAKWKGKNGEEEFSQLFSRTYVFGPTASGDLLACRVQKRACDYARDFMRSILAQRGAL